FGVSPEKEAQLLARMQELAIDESDIEEKFIKGSGPGGQKINKTSSCVYLCHRPSGIEIKCQQTRSQALNRFHARRELCERIAAEQLGKKTKRQAAAEKVRRQKRRRSRRAKATIRAEKEHRSQLKSRRKPPEGGE
ncbi:MAG: peptide chain release factor-like protein, partial [Bdellovibrionales bacterium]|nr:peptide chain release factor-like protein [Bdellovibrionales bacterium]